MIVYVRNVDGNRTIYFKINDSKLLKKYNQIQKKVEKLLKIKFDSEPVYGDDAKYIKIKIKTYGARVNTNFQGKGVPREKAPCNWLSIMMLDPAVKAKKKNILKLFWRNANMNEKKKRITLLMMIQKKVHLMSRIMKLIMILMMKRNLMMIKIMMNPMNNSLKAKKVF